MDASEGQMFERNMINACIMGQLDVIDRYIEAYDVNDFLSTGWTPLLYAASTAQAEVIEHLIKNGALVNKHKNGYTPLMALCSLNKGPTDQRIKCLRILIDAGANANASNKQRQSALMYACTVQAPEFVTELLKYVKNINAFDHRKQTALVYATVANRPDIVKILMENAADPTLTDYNGVTAIDIASMKRYNEIVSLFNLNKDESINMCEIAKICDWKDMFPSLTSISKYTIDSDVFTILCGMNLDKYSYIFQELDLKTFLKLTEDDLCRLGMDINVHRMQFQEQLHKFHRKQWSVRSIGVINRLLPYTLYDGIVSLSIVAKQVAVIGSSFEYIKNSLLRENDMKMCFTKQQIADYEQELKKTKETLSILKKELLQIQALSKVLQKENDIGIPATYIGPKTHGVNWTTLLSITLIIGIYLFKTICIQK